MILIVAEFRYTSTYNTNINFEFMAFKYKKRRSDWDFKCEVKTIIRYRAKNAPNQ